MYKVYLSPSLKSKSIGVENYGLESYQMNKIADEVEKCLEKDGKFIIFRSKEFMTREEIIDDSKSIKPDIHIAIHSKMGDKEGPECYTKVNSEISNGFAKEIYKAIQSIYYNKDIDNGVIYDDKIIEIMSVNSPAVLIQVGCHESVNDARWIEKNTKNIGEAIANGIITGFELKPC